MNLTSTYGQVTRGGLSLVPQVYNTRSSKEQRQVLTHLSGDVKLVHHLQFVVHLDATFHQVKFTVLKVTEVKLQDLRLFGAW